MKVCFPTDMYEGIESKVYGHFGSAPIFIIVDTETDNISIIDNKDKIHSHGACNPIKALGKHKVDAIVVGGIGTSALNRLNLSGIKVYQAKSSTVKANIDMFKSQSLPELTSQHCCGGHSHGKGCSH